MISSIPHPRIFVLNPALPNPTSEDLSALNTQASQIGDFILYWMIATRRLSHNFALDFALNSARALGKPLLVLEPLSLRYPYLSQRFDRFVLEGMADTIIDADRFGISYYPYAETQPGQAEGLLDALVKNAAILITDHYPTTPYKRLHQSARALGQKHKTPLIAIDSCGFLPLRQHGKALSRAYSFRRVVHKTVLEAVPTFPDSMPNTEGVAAVPFDAPYLPENWRQRWPRWDGSLGIKHPRHTSVPHFGPSGFMKGGRQEGLRRLSAFLSRLETYAQRNQPEADATSGLSAHLHFGHLSSFDVLSQLWLHCGWAMDRVRPESVAKREGFWGLPEAAESFLDELITWRELGHGYCHFDPDYEHYHSLPAWAQQSLAEHSHDPRQYIYTLEEFEKGLTHEPLWNAAQNQLVREGRIHNYLRMLWGKMILGWSQSPQEALNTMVLLNNRYAYDGRDPNSYAGIMWVLGRFDRAWGPERPVFGKIRYMTPDSTRRKLKVKNYIATYA